MTQFSSALPQKKAKSNHESINETDLNILIRNKEKKQFRICMHFE